MSDKYAPNLTCEEMDQLLCEEDVGRLAMCCDSQPYCVPVNYAFLDGKIVFHCAVQGRKLDFLRANPRVCFVVDRHPDRLQPHHPDGKCNYRFESVLCFGTARVLEDPCERRDYLQKFRTHFNLRLGLPADQDSVAPEQAETCGCVVLTLEERTGRRKD
mgnify:CR=1 FL=1